MEQDDERTDCDRLPPADTLPPTGARRSYLTPVLIRWGTLNELTKTVGSQGKNDGGVPNYGRKTR